MENPENGFSEPYADEMNDPDPSVEPDWHADGGGFEEDLFPDEPASLDHDEPGSFPEPVEEPAPTDAPIAPPPELTFPESPTPIAEESEFPNFDSAAAAEVVGDPAAEMLRWHLQEQPDTCAVASQEFVLESLTGQEFSEAQLVREATDNGWYTPGAGTSLENTGRLLEAHGVPTASGFGATVDDLRAQLEAGERIIVGIDGDELRVPGEDTLADELLEDSTGIPGQDANHAVEVIGMTESAHGPVVVLNDPGLADGRGMMVPVSEFENAWEDSGNFEVRAGAGVAAQTTGLDPQAQAGLGLGHSSTPEES
jgi:hypothetical protein